METLSEAMHRALKRGSCPNVCACDASITRDFFSRISGRRAHHPHVLAAEARLGGVQTETAI